MILVLFSMLADKLSMSPEAAEKWIVNLIRKPHLLNKNILNIHLYICLKSKKKC